MSDLLVLICKTRQDKTPGQIVDLVVFVAILFVFLSLSFLDNQSEIFFLSYPPSFYLALVVCYFTRISGESAARPVGESTQKLSRATKRFKGENVTLSPSIPKPKISSVQKKKLNRLSFAELLLFGY